MTVHAVGRRGVAPVNGHTAVTAARRTDALLTGTRRNAAIRRRYCLQARELRRLRLR